MLPGGRRPLPFFCSRFGPFVSIRRVLLCSCVLAVGSMGRRLPRIRRCERSWLVGLATKHSPVPATKHSPDPAQEATTPFPLPLSPRRLPSPLPLPTLPRLPLLPRRLRSLPSPLPLSPLSRLHFRLPRRLPRLLRRYLGRGRSWGRNPRDLIPRCARQPPVTLMAGQSTGTLWSGDASRSLWPGYRALRSRAAWRPLGAGRPHLSDGDLDEGALGHPLGHVRRRSVGLVDLRGAAGGRPE